MDLGGVGHYENGVVTVNIDSAAKPDIKCDITARANELKNHFDKETVDMFLCVHTLEHISTDQVYPTLKYWLEFLKPAGRLLVVVPDLGQMWKDFMEEKVSADTIIAVTFRRSPFSFSPRWSTHQWGWTRYTLRRDMHNCGYITLDHPERAFGIPHAWFFDYKDFSWSPDYKKYMVPNLKVLGVKQNI